MSPSREERRPTLLGRKLDSLAQAGHPRAAELLILADQWDRAFARHTTLRQRIALRAKITLVVDNTRP